MGSHKQIVLHIPKWYPNRYDSLLGIFVKRHILSMTSSAQQIVLFAAASPENKHWMEIEEVIEEEIVTYRCFYKKHITRINALDRMIKLCLYFISILVMYGKARRKFGKPDVVQAHVLLRTACISYFIGRLERRPYFILEHATRFTRHDISPFTNRVDYFITRFVILHSKAVIAVSQSLADSIRNKCKVPQHNFFVIYNCVDTLIFHPGVFRQSEKKQLIYVAEFTDKAKNISGLLNVVASLSRKRDDFILRMVGYGADEAWLKSQASSLGVLDRTVFFMGKKIGNELSDMIRNADALVLFSNFENLPCVITEAFCCGTPVISTNVGGIEEIVNQNNGILIAKGDEEAMAASIERIIEDRKKFDRLTIAKEASVLFSNEHIGKAFMNIYQKV